MEIPIGFGQINFRFTGTSLPFGAEITFGFKNDAVWTAAVAAANFENMFLAADFDAAYVNTVTMSGVLVKLGPNSTGAAALEAASIVGTASGQTGYAGASALVRKVTAIGGRTGQGRFFMPGIAEVDILPGGALSGSVVAQLQLASDAFLSAAATAGAPLALLHADAGPSPYPIVDLLVQSQAATQRRRQRR